MNCSQYKHAAPALVSCVPVKRSLVVQPSTSLLEKAPCLSSYYMRLYGMDIVSSMKALPINHAIRGAIEQVSLYYNFRRKPA